MQSWGQQGNHLSTSTSHGLAFQPVRWPPLPADKWESSCSICNMVSYQHSRTHIHATRTQFQRLQTMVVSFTYYSLIFISECHSLHFARLPLFPFLSIFVIRDLPRTCQPLGSQPSSTVVIYLINVLVIVTVKISEMNSNKKPANGQN